MALLGIDLGGTKLASALFSENGDLLFRETVNLEKREGSDVGLLITDQIGKMMNSGSLDKQKIDSMGISVPGICHSSTGTVWVPNIPGWADYPLLSEVKEKAGDIPVIIDSDRACHMLGELWQGKARGCRNAVFLAVGTGIGAGFLVNGNILRGSNDIAGAIGWMALNRPFEDKYLECGCFEYHASGEGIAKVTKDYLREDLSYYGVLRRADILSVTAHDVFEAYETGDPIAVKVIGQCIEYWGMAVANLVSLFNPEKIILGGGVFGPAKKFMTAINVEASKWAQPVSMTRVTLEISSLEGDAGVYGAAYLALKNLADHNIQADGNL